MNAFDRVGDRPVADLDADGLGDFPDLRNDVLGEVLLEDARVVELALGRVGLTSCGIQPSAANVSRAASSPRWRTYQSSCAAVP